MSYKTGGYKTTWEPSVSSYEKKRVYTIYTAEESVSEVQAYEMEDEDGNPVSLGPHYEEIDDKGKESLIDVLYYLKHKGAGRYEFGAPWRDIVIKEMTDEEMDRVFINPRKYVNYIRTKDSEASF